jgi:hypothetical protein
MLAGHDAGGESEAVTVSWRTTMAACSAKGRQPASPVDKRLYTLEVFLIEGPMSDEFCEKNPQVSRTIQIRGDQTLEDLHHAIFNAFNREEEHMYEFQIGGKGPHDPNARCYPISEAFDSGNPGHARGDEAGEACIGSLGLKTEDAFGYWFDFGDDWWHQINVVAIDSEIPSGKYPKVTKRVGDSPPQYADWDEEEEDDEDEFDEDEEDLDEDEEEEYEEEEEEGDLDEEGEDDGKG